MRSPRPISRRLPFLLFLGLALLLLRGLQAPGGPDPAHGTAEPDLPLQVHFLDVGQGDAVLIDVPGDAEVLVDAGPPPGSDLLAYLRAHGVTRFRYVIATHPHADHIGGMAAVLAAFPVERFFMPAAVHTTQAFEQMTGTLGREGIPVTVPAPGAEFWLDSGIRITFLSPESGPRGEGESDLNDSSLVFRLDFDQASFVFTGDAGRDVEARLVAGQAPLAADVLKVGHHGSADATSVDFVRRVSPRVAVISVGEGNEYGHPHRETLATLEAAGVRAYRTDRDGEVVVGTDGQRLWISTAGVERFPPLEARLRYNICAGIW